MRAALVAAVFAMLGTAALAAVDVNLANQAELEAVRGVGPSLAEQILAARRKAAFKDWNDFVDRVRGVGAGSAARLSAAGLTIDGSVYKPAAASAAKP